MKLEYSYYGDMPSLIIKGADFVKESRIEKN
jgi:hypothetical protein